MNPSLLLIPDRYKASKLYSQIPDSGAGDLAFTRANDTATRVNSQGLIEKVRTNVILQSNTFSDAAWTKINATVTQGVTDAFGGSLGWTLSKSASDGRVQSPYTLSGIHNISLYAKAGTLNWLRISDNGGVNAYFDLQNGTTTSVVSSITLVSNGWYRVTVPSSSGSFVIIYPADGNGDVSGTSGNILISFNQVETGDIATPYIPTTTAAVSVGMLANIPRIDYTGGGCGKLLLEPQRTNLAQFSEQFDNAYWTKYEATITANASSSPDGFVNADKFIDSTANDFHALFRGFVVSVNSTFSIFVKAAEYSRVSISNASDGGDVIFNLSTSTVVSSSANFINAKIETYANGWRRISATTSGVSGSKAIGLFLVNNSGLTSFVGTGTSGIFVYGAQFEEATYATSYIPTLGASVTRGTDAASKTGISSLIGQTEGVLFLDYTALNITVPFLVDFQIQDDPFLNRITIFQTADTPSVDIRRNGVSQFSASLSPTSLNGRNKIALAYRSNDFAVFQNGVLMASQSFGSLPTSLSALRISDGDRYYKINAAAIYPTRLSNAQLASLTSL